MSAMFNVFLDVHQHIGEDVRTGIVGALIASLLGFLGTAIWGLVVELRYPFRGRYLSIYDEIRPDGVPVVATEDVVLKQAGRVVRQFHKTQDDRSWNCTGIITANGSVIRGIVDSTKHSRTPETVAIYILKRREKFDFDGFWAGYGAAARQLQSGKMRIHKKPDLKIRLCSERDDIEVAAVLDQSRWRLPAHELAEEGAQIIGAFTPASSPPRRTRIFRHFQKYTSLIGIGVFRRVDSNYLKRVDLVAERLPEPILNAMKRGNLLSLTDIVVLPSCRERGVATDIISYFMQRLRPPGTAVIAYEDGTGKFVEAAKMLGKMGFYLYRRQENGYWLEYDRPSIYHPLPKDEPLLLLHTVVPKR